MGVGFEMGLPNFYYLLENKGAIAVQTRHLEFSNGKDFPRVPEEG